MAKGAKLIAVGLVVFVVAVGLGYWFIVQRMGYVNQTSSGSVVQDGSLDLIDQSGKTVGDLGQPYADLSSFSYSYNGSLSFRFALQGNIPSTIASAHVADFWYQILVDTDLNPNTGYRLGSDFTPDYILMLHVVFNNASRTVDASASILKYSGTGTDFAWQQVASLPVVGGVGQDFVILTCKYQDLSVSRGSTLQFMGRSGIRYDGQVYNDQVPDQGTLKITL